MKSNVIFFLLGISFFGIMSFQETNNVNQNQITDFRDAKVKMNTGMALFIECEPINKYKYLGTIKIGVVWSGKNQEMINLATKKAKNEYPDCNGIIFTSQDLDKFDVVKFE